MERVGGRTGSALALRKPQLAQANATLSAANANLERARRNLNRSIFIAPFKEELNQKILMLELPYFLEHFLGTYTQLMFLKFTCL